MRRPLLPLLVLAVVIGSCTRGPSSTGPVSPRDEGDVTRASAGDEAGARGAAIAFLHGYALAPNDGGASLTVAVAPAGWIQRWAHWVGVQGQRFPGDQEGELVLRSVGPAVAPTPGPPIVRTVDVDAVVRFRLEPDEGAPFELTRAFTGVRLARVRSSGWVVTDAIRDGVPLSASFVAFDPPMPSAASGGIRVRLDSLVIYPALQFHLLVVASDDATLSAAQLLDPSGDVVAEAGTGTEAIRSVRTREPVEGIVTFEPLDLSEGLALRLVYVVDGRDRKLTFDLDEILGDIGASTTA